MVAAIYSAPADTTLVVLREQLLPGTDARGGGPRLALLEGVLELLAQHRGGDFDRRREGAGCGVGRQTALRRAPLLCSAHNILHALSSAPSEGLHQHVIDLHQPEQTKHRERETISKVTENTNWSERSLSTHRTKSATSILAFAPE